MKFGKDNKDTTNIMSLVIGEDRMVNMKPLKSTGVYLIDDHNRVCYDSYPEAIADCVEIKDGKERYLGQICVLYEPMARPFSFQELNWVPKKAMKKDDVILDNGLAEAHSLVIQAKEREDRQGWFKTIGLAVFGLFVVMLLLYIIQSGLLSKIIGG